VIFSARQHEVIDLQPKADPCYFNYVDYKQAKALGPARHRDGEKSTMSRYDDLKENAGSQIRG
jgi:hypothetical protein